MKNKKGFTLYELIAVIAIIVIILGIAIFAIVSIVGTSSRSSFEENAQLILKAIYYKEVSDSTFDPSAVNEKNIDSLLDVKAEGYKTITVKVLNDDTYITIVGNGKWDGLTASGTSTNINIEDSVISFSNGANAPVLSSGMTPIKWNGSSWVTTTIDDTDWYNYTTTDKKWANAKTDDGSMWVWIPRFIYRIKSGWHLASTGEIEVQFSKGIDDNWNKADIGNINLDPTSNASNNTWTNHPAFTFGATELTGIWVGKFEASSNTPNAVNGGGNDTSLYVKSVPNVASWRSISIGNIFTVVRGMENNLVYGFAQKDNDIDTHMMKNIEWGAVTYLSQSIYGKNDELWINNDSTYTTGCAGDSVSAIYNRGCLNSYNTTDGMKASTTGNIYGIYDMSGGAYEYVAGYFATGHSYLSQNGSSILGSNSKYKNVYQGYKSYIDVRESTLSSKGDAMYETSIGAWYDGASWVGKETSWNNDYSYYPYYACPWLIRGGNYSYSQNGGVFNYTCTIGSSHVAYGFRPVIIINQDF
ncbi:MAG: prepilin-type N-terminal cleavage/methylation domain-containing protein [Bacilli bacterium]|jgi:type IV pilus assembly protein PilA